MELTEEREIAGFVGILFAGEDALYFVHPGGFDIRCGEDCAKLWLA